MPMTPLGWLYLFLICLWFPWVAVRSARRLHGAKRETPPRSKVFTSIMIVQVFVLAIAAYTAHVEYLNLFPNEVPATAGILAAAVFFAFMVGTIPFRMFRTDARRARALDLMFPHATRDLPLFAVLCVIVGVAEEVAFRGTAFELLARNAEYFLGLTGETKWWVAMLVTTFAFSAAHVMQGWRSVLVILFVAIVLQWIVRLSGNLYAAMAVHAAYDFAAGLVYVLWGRAKMGTGQAAATS